MSKDPKNAKGRQPVVDLGGRSYEEIAKACGVRKSVAHRWLTGQSVPRTKAAIATLAKAVGVKSDALLLAIYRGRAA